VVVYVVQVANVEPREICSVYEVAPDDATHVRVGVLVIPVAIVPGEYSTGTAGTEQDIVVNDHPEDQPLVPQEFVALIRQ
jgi:hypothetical protein